MTGLGGAEEERRGREDERDNETEGGGEIERSPEKHLFFAPAYSGRY